MNYETVFIEVDMKKPLGAFEIQEKHDYLRQEPVKKKNINHDDLKQGEEFLMQKTCPGCGCLVLGKKEQDFQCQHCFLEFKFQKKIKNLPPIYETK